MSSPEYNRARNVVIYTIGMLNDLANDGTLANTNYQLSASGMAQYVTLKAQGFEPAASEIVGAVFGLRHEM